MIFFRFLCLLLFLNISCQNHGVSITRKSDTCLSIIQKFNYPVDLNRVDTMHNSCVYNSLKTPTYISNIFEDKKYAVYSHKSGSTKILYDKENEFVFAFMNASGWYDFSDSSLERLYILNLDLMPLYSISVNESGSIIYEKFFYDMGAPELISYIILLKNFQLKTFKELSYDKLLILARELYHNNYEKTMQWYRYDPIFKTLPQWTEG